MKNFEIHFLDSLNVTVIVRAYFAPDDLTALAEAHRLCATHQIEIWDGDRLVAKVRRGDLPSATKDRRCG